MQLYYFSPHQAVAKENIQPQTKLVLYTILNHFTSCGIYLKPAFNTLITQSGMTREIFINHLHDAHASGFAEITTRVLEQINEQ